MSKIYFILLIAFLNYAAGAGEYLSEGEILNVQENHKYVYINGGRDCPYPESLNKNVCESSPDGYNVIFMYDGIEHYIHLDEIPKAGTIKLLINIKPLIRP